MNMIDAKNQKLKEVSQALKAAMNGDPIHIHNADQIHGMAGGLKGGEVIVEGNAGDYLGVLNDGATIRVTQSVGKYAADNMTDGLLIIDGDADYGAGQYCYGGTLVVYGDAGDFTGTMNKGATIIIGGDIGDEAGTYMLAGDLVVVGDAGENFANYLIRGKVYIGGTWSSLGHNTRLEPLTDEDIQKLDNYFKRYEVDAEPSNFKKLVAASEKPFYK